MLENLDGFDPCYCDEALMTTGDAIAKDFICLAVESGMLELEADEPEQQQQD